MRVGEQPAADTADAARTRALVAPGLTGTSTDDEGNGEALGEENLENSGVRHWTDLLARIRFGTQVVNGRKVTSATIKAVGNRLASYADFRTGGRVRPGLARLAIDLEISHTTTKAAVAVLRRVGLLRLVSAGSRHDAATYQLVIPADLLERTDIEVLSPAAHDLAVARIRADVQEPKGSNGGTHGACVEPVDNPSTGAPTVPVLTSDPQSNTGTVETGNSANTGTVEYPTQAPTVPVTSHGPTTREISQPVADVGTAITADARASPAEDPIPSCREPGCAKGWNFTTESVTRCSCDPSGSASPPLRLIHGGAA